MGIDDIRRAVEGYAKKQLGSSRPRAKRNASPEKDLVKLILKACETRGWSCHVVESKAVYNASAGRYISGQTVQGFTDIVGCDNQGISMWIEVKAPGKRSTLKEHQRQFLIEKISKNAFAVCIDSVELLYGTYAGWLDAQNKKSYLLKLLP